jgi:SAM-dependent methyltransferase
VTRSRGDGPAASALIAPASSSARRRPAPYPRGPRASAERLARGEFFTAAPVAQLALAALAPFDANLRVLDPTCGDGAFLAAASSATLADLVGLDIDRDAAEKARARVPGAHVVVGDLLDPDLVDRLGLFDLVIGNPPYVRAGTLEPALKRARAAVLQADWPELDRSALDAVARLADTSAACILRALRLTRPGGRLALVVSTALLDTDAAAPLWRLVERIAHVRAIIVAPRERWFDDAAVNSMLLVVERRAVTSGSERLDGADVRLLRLRVPTATAAREVGLDAIAAHADERRASRHAPATWGPALRAPAAWWRWRDIAGDLLVPLRELAEIRRGLTTGANDVFYVTRDDARALRLEREYLRPVVRSPFNGSPAPIAIDPDDVPLLAIALPPDPNVLRGARKIRAWLARHESKIAGTSVARRDPWWSLPIDPARLFLAKAYGPRFVQRLAPVPVLADQRVYGLHPRPGVDVEVLAAVLNALPTALALESLGRASMGFGVVEWTVRDAHELPVLDVRRLDEEARARLRTALAAFGGRRIEHARIERERADRADLDRAVLDLAGGDDLLEVMWSALLDSVALRDRYLLPPV